jgi:methylated-DNA-[protein]-cysteine S-methyltransferase
LRFVDFLERRSLKRAFAAHAGDLPDAKWEPSLLELKPVVDQLEGYFSGMLTRFDLALDLVGTDFQLSVWRALRTIPYGQTRAYGQIAKAIRQPNAARAVGLANNRNPIPIIIPCHRVIGADGSLTGYGGGLPRKRKLLEMEGRFARLSGRTADLFAGA